MRDYIKMYFATWHVEQPPLSPVDGQTWRGEKDEFDAELVRQRELWTSSGWTFTITGEFKAYWLLNKRNFSQIIQDFAEVNNLAPTYIDQDPPLVVLEESPRGDEPRMDALVPLRDAFELIGDFKDGDISKGSFLNGLILLLDPSEAE